MAQIPFVGPSYVYDSLAFDLQRSVNYFPVVSESNTSASKYALHSSPGYKLFCQFPTLKARWGLISKGRGFVVFGNGFYEIFSDGTFVLRGNLLSHSGMVRMASSGFQLLIVDGANGYIFTLSSNEFKIITSEGWKGSDTVGFVMGYFLLHEPDTDKYYITELYDGLIVDPLDFATADGVGDNIVALGILRTQCYLFNTYSTEVVFNSGGGTTVQDEFPFSEIPSGFTNYGIASAASLAQGANSLFWIGKDESGEGIVWMCTGYQPERISTFAIENLLQKCDLSKIGGYIYQEGGRYFYQLNIEEQNTSLVYDINIKQWHEMAFYNSVKGKYERHRGEFHIHIFGKHLVGDYTNGNLYEQSNKYDSFDTDPMRGMRVLPYLMGDNQEFLYFERFQIEVERGGGKNDGDIQDTDPMLYLDWSDDGGHTWIQNGRYLSFGKIGQYTGRLVANMCGRGRKRVFRIVTSGNYKKFLIAAYADIIKGNS